MKAKVKTAELAGIALDWAVAKCEGHCLATGVFVPAWGRGEWAPSNDWAHAGPIIEREHIGVAFNRGQWVAFYMTDEVNEDCWDFKLSTNGPTALIAAMRCYVAGHFGVYIEVPQELLA